MSLFAKVVAAPLALAATMWSGAAHADCTGFYPNEEMWCYPPVSWDRYESVYAVIGSDPHDGSSHWIAWMNYTTGACHWDQIGDSNRLELGGYNPRRGTYEHIPSVQVQGNYGDDMLVIINGVSYTCGYELRAVSFSNPNGNAVNLSGDDGHDFLFSMANGRDSYIIGGADNDSVYSTQSDVFIDGESGDDVIEVEGSQAGGFFWGDSGNDLIVNYSSAFSITGCGDGTDDAWCGPGQRPSDCERTYCY